MANARFFNSDGYGQLELNSAAFLKTGNIEAQCAPNAVFTTSLPLENGMIVVVDKANDEIDLADTTETRPFGIVYTAEKIYNQFTPGLKYFKMTASDGFYPRVGYLTVGDKFTTNCVAADTGTYANETALVSALDSVTSTPLYGAYTTDLGAIAISTVAPTAGPVLSVVKKTTLADGQTAVKFQVIG